MPVPAVAFDGIPGLVVYRDVIDSESSRQIRDRLFDVTLHQASEIIVGSQRHAAPRLTSSFSDAPLSMEGMRDSQPWSPEVQRVRDAVSEIFGLTFNYALANLYRDRLDHTGWHADKAWLHEPGSTIAIASFGARRTLSVREAGGEPVVRIPLTDSSVALMTLDLQRTHEHAILAEDDEAGCRLSITLRHIKVLAEYVGGRPHRQTGGASSTERNEPNVVHRKGSALYR